MSLRAMTEVFYASKTKPAARAVLLAIADNANDEGTHAFPSIQTLAKKSGMSVRTVIRTIQQLEQMGELSVERSPSRRNGYANVYTLHVGSLNPRPQGSGAKLAPEKSSANLAPEKSSAKSRVSSDNSVTPTVLIERSSREQSVTGETDPAPDDAPAAETPASAGAQLWEHALVNLQFEMTSGNYETWLRHTQGLTFDGRTLVVGVPSRHIKSNLETRFMPIIRRALAVLVGRPIEVRYRLTEGS